MEKFRKVTQSFTKFQFKYVSNRNFIKLYQRYRIFFPRKSSFLCTLTGKSNKWMKMLFSFPAPEKKNSFEIEWMNGQRTFPRAKKKTENLPEIFWKHTKNLPVFFSAFPEKKTRFSDLHDWMANVHAHGKKYGTFDSI